MPPVHTYAGLYVVANITVMFIFSRYSQSLPVIVQMENVQKVSGKPVHTWLPGLAGSDLLVCIPA